MLDLIKKNKKILGIGAILFLGISFFASDKHRNVIKFDSISPKFKVVVQSEKKCELASVDYFINYYNVVDKVPLIGDYLLSDGIYLPHFNKIIKLDINKLTKKNETKYLCLQKLEKNEKDNLIKNIEQKTNNNLIGKIKIKNFGDKELLLINNLHYSTKEEANTPITETLGYIVAFGVVLFLLSLAKL